MKVNHVIASLSASSGGPARSVPLLCEALSQFSEVEISTVESVDRVSLPQSISVSSFSSSLPFVPVGCSSDLGKHLLKK